jgi:glycosyltransferase involved in cell wall biosynthesis
MDILGGSIAILTGVPWVMSERSSAAAYPRQWKHELRCWMASQATAVVANSSKGVEYWRPKLRDSVRLVAIDNGIPVEEIEKVGAESGHQDSKDAQIVLFAGRFVPERNLKTLIEALHIVLRGGGRRAVLCGDGPERGLVERQLLNLGLQDRVILTGQVKEMQLWQWMRRAAVFVSLSFFEGQPNSVLEAMAARCPLVVSDIPEHRDFIGADAALFVDPREVAGAAQAIDRTLSDRTQSRSRADAAYEICKVRTVSKMAREYCTFYREIATG